MAHTQIIADLMANLRHSRLMIELFGDDHAKDFNEGKSSPATPCKSTLTDSSSRYGGHKFTTSKFLQHYPALMDPRNFLQLITKYTATDILLWANNGRQLPILSNDIMFNHRKKVMKLMSERTPGGEEMLKKIIDIVKSHNRLDDRKQKFTHIRPEVICMKMDAWYECISQSTASDVHTLPLYFRYFVDSQEALTLLLGNSGTQRVSLTLSELLHDPLFPYRKLQDIPDDVLLEWCASHSYPHVLDKLKVNNPCVSVTQENIKIRVESLIHPPVLWIPEIDVENTGEDDTMSIDSRDSLFADDEDMEDEPVVEHFLRCGSCLDNGVANCNVDTSLRQPGQLCTRCESLGQPCEDRSPSEHQASLHSNTFKRDYCKRQMRDGHLAEQKEELFKAWHSSSYRTFAVRAPLYLLLLDEASGWRDSPAKASGLCLPMRKPDECKILALVESVSEPCITTNLAKQQATLLSSSTTDKKNFPVDINADQSNEDDDAQEEDIEEIVMIACNKLAERW